MASASTIFMEVIAVLDTYSKISPLAIDYRFFPLTGINSLMHADFAGLIRHSRSN